MSTASVTFLRTDPVLSRDGQRAVVEAWLGPVARTCPHCGSGDHGRPRTGDRHLSLAYAPGLIAVAIADVPIGVDAEALGSPPAPFADRQAWTVAEAVLKLTGEGVRREPATVRADEAWTSQLPAPTGYVAALAAHAETEVSCRTGTAAELDPPATAAATP